MRGLLFTLILLGAVAENAPAQATRSPASAENWIPLFDGKTLSGWTAPDPGEWEITSEGVLVSKGKRSHLFSPLPYTNFQFRAEVKTKTNSNGGIYFHAQVGPGWPKGYEAQINNSYHRDPRKTGSLYGFQDVRETLVPDETWWTYHIIAVGNRMILKVNDRICVNYTDEKNTHSSGHFAFQQHDPGGVIMFRNVAVKPLPADPAAAWAEATKDLGGLPR